ncbi:MAG: type II toxin-antitoxin system Phd/YefM family antitoxin [Deinococcus sp.]|uniref:type II toxin-antitoxin system Phd/YefM family antitoxin n=1 Tax=Deinococcus sp. TaxID=47478 RepID=UPI0026DC5D90|nr:type II toxin-antitoxin system Phd/YefM family antitoxin [Deinococcus sp.]MDO4244436.1 type II toxin-antitoxin system Phd/YefM family antitoxin [Deinococcus sp.]
MTAYSLKYFEENAGRIVREASENAESIYITLDNGEAVILKPAGKDKPWSETDPVLNHPANREHILASIAEYRSGKTLTPDLDALDVSQP